jgi:hypothetical protein
MVLVIIGLVVIVLWALAVMQRDINEQIQRELDEQGWK